MRVVEVLAEANALGLTLSATSLESGIRTYAKGGQWQRAEDVFRKLRSQGHQPDMATVEGLISSLSAAKQGERALALLNECSAALKPEARDAAYNTVLKALARQGHVNKAYEMLNVIMKKGEINVAEFTFGTIANEFLKAGQDDLADEVLEMRDYM